MLPTFINIPQKCCSEICIILVTKYPIFLLILQKVPIVCSISGIYCLTSHNRNRRWVFLISPLPDQEAFDPCLTSRLDICFKAFELRARTTEVSWWLKCIFYCCGVRHRSSSEILAQLLLLPSSRIPRSLFSKPPTNISFLRQISFLSYIARAPFCWKKKQKSWITKVFSKLLSCVQ